jgi:hypothetical protein
MTNVFQTSIPSELNERIEDYRWKKRLKKTEVARLLIEKGLEKLKEEKNS